MTSDHSERRRIMLFLGKDSGETLLALKQRGHDEGVWSGITGEVMSGEKIEEALVRKCYEETGATPTHYYPVAEYDFEEYDGEQVTHLHTCVYYCDEWRGDIAEAGEATLKWYDDEELPYEHMRPDCHYWLPKVMEGQKVFCMFQLDEVGNVLSHSVDVVETLPVEQKI